jgi:CheY-like chemotaxis protein
MTDKKQMNVLLADDDEDDRFFFAKALDRLQIKSSLVSVEDGAELINYLSTKTDNLPNVLFLDINMPRKNGYECLLEVKSNKKTKDLPVVMYSTSLEDTMADLLYQKGAHYYLHKGDFQDLVKYLQLILTRLDKNNFRRPSRTQFVVNLIEA